MGNGLGRSVAKMINSPNISDTFLSVLSDRALFLRARTKKSATKLMPYAALSQNENVSDTPLNFDASLKASLETGHLGTPNNGTSPLPTPTPHGVASTDRRFGARKCPRSGFAESTLRHHGATAAGSFSFGWKTRFLKLPDSLGRTEILAFINPGCNSLGYSLRLDASSSLS